MDVGWTNYKAMTMTTPSTLVSLRITEEEMALLDSRVGLDGAKQVDVSAGQSGRF